MLVSGRTGRQYLLAGLLTSGFAPSPLTVPGPQEGKKIETSLSPQLPGSAPLRIFNTYQPALGGRSCSGRRPLLLLEVSTPLLGLPDTQTMTQLLPSPSSPLFQLGNPTQFRTREALPEFPPPRGPHHISRVSTAAALSRRHCQGGGNTGC